MRLAVLAIVLSWMPRAEAQPAATWKDVPALLGSATAPVAADLRNCVTTLPRTIGLFATRSKGGTQVSIPLYGVGGRGLTKEERCLSKVVARIVLPPLPAEIERVGLAYTIADSPVTPGFGAWRDPIAVLATVIDASRRSALASCDARPRTVRLVLDLRRRATRVWLPAWQFHSPSGDGSTPVSERRVKACLAKVIATWKPPVLPAAMGELQLAIPMG